MSSKQNKEKPNKSNKTALNLSKTEKSFSNVKLIYLLVFLIVAGFVLLLASGTFTTPKVVVTNTQQSNVQNNPHSSADMNSLQQIKDLEEHLVNNPSDSKSLLSLGHLLNDNGFYDKAIEKYKLYLNTFPQEADVWVDMGVCYFELKDYDKAIVNMEKAVSINPKHQIAHLNLGIVNLSANNIQKAKQWWEKAISIDPNTDAAKKAKDLLNSN